MKLIAQDVMVMIQQKETQHKHAVSASLQHGMITEFALVIFIQLEIFFFILKIKKIKIFPRKN